MASGKPLGPKRGEIYLVSFDPTVRAEIQKTRPAAILQNDIGNEHSPVTIVAALSSNPSRRGPVGVLVPAQPEA
jgi:mRNA interferase MazF